MYNGQRIAVLFRVGDDSRVVCGRITDVVDDQDLGPVLRVALEQDEPDAAGPTTLILSEESLQGRLAVGDRYGCDLCVDLGPPTARQQPRGDVRRLIEDALSSGGPSRKIEEHLEWLANTRPSPTPV